MSMRYGKDIRHLIRERRNKFCQYTFFQFLLSGNMKRYGDLSQVMKMLQMTGDVRFELHGNDVYITTE